MKVIFLDIDGVLNGHHYMREAESCNIRHDCVRQLNRIIRRTGAKIVLSSAWRYIIHGKAMTLSGFGYMMRTHGFIGASSIIGLTEPDETCPDCGHVHRRRHRTVACKFNARGFRVCVKCSAESTRGKQIGRWLKQNGKGVKQYVVLDDDDLEIKNLHPFVKTKARIGLTRGAADRAIAILLKP